ncbi:MAG: ATP-binding protein [Oscillospiraceae bacterium]|nr:ATP-binding protein [Oscillospiraceae bacterium]
MKKQNRKAEREGVLQQLLRGELLILDDLGAERNTSYARERVFDLVSRRTLSRQPIIVTTNLSLTAMQKATELEERRIYDRVLECCVPVLFDGENFRRRKAAEILKKAAEILSGA